MPLFLTSIIFNIHSYNAIIHCTIIILSSYIICRGPSSCIFIAAPLSRVASMGFRAEIRTRACLTASRHLYLFFFRFLQEGLLFIKVISSFCSKGHAQFFSWFPQGWHVLVISYYYLNTVEELNSSSFNTSDDQTDTSDTYICTSGVFARNIFRGFPSAYLHG